MRKQAEKFMEITFQDPVLKNSFEWYDLNREEMKEVLYKKIRRAAEIDKDLFINNFEVGTNYAWTNLHLGLFPIGLHHSMFMMCMKTLTTEE